MWKRCRSTVIHFVVLCAHVLLSLGVVLGVLGDMDARRATQHAACDPPRYVPSPLERWWLQNAGLVAEQSKRWSRGCEAVVADVAGINKWLEVARDRETSSNSGWSPDIFSYHEYCPGGARMRVPIEPLFAMLRHPRFHCFGCSAGCKRNEDFATALNKSHLLPPWHDEVLSRQPSRRAFLFDLGASTYTAGAGGASMSWFITSYERRGIVFDRVLAWEAKLHPPEKIFGPPLPPAVLHRLSYFNLPLSVIKGHRHNPLSAVAELVRPDDFAVVKVDFDSPTLEAALVEQMLAPEISALVDELYFEQHVGDIALAKYKYGPKVGARLNESYDLFSRLRFAGIRAHPWV